MKITQFQSEVANIEGKKVQVSIGNVREVLSIVRNRIKKASGIDIYDIIKKM